MLYRCNKYNSWKNLHRTLRSVWSTGTDVYMGVELPISDVRQHPEKFPNVKRLVESDDFFMMQEYNNVKTYYEKLLRRIQDEEDSDDLFD